MEKESRPRCISIKSKKHPDQRCPNTSRAGTEWCSNHSKSQIKFVESCETNPSCSNAAPIRPKRIVVSKTVYNKAIKCLQKFWICFGRKMLWRQQGPATFLPELAHNDKDISTYDSVDSIPLCYRFSYIDSKQHLWLFDTRFLINLLQYGSDVKNPFTQEPFDKKTLERLQVRAEQLKQMKKAIVYISEDVLTPEQQWNQKVLDVFLKLTTLGYGVNIQWFEGLTLRGHQMFYSKLFELWNSRLGLTNEDRERIVPGCLDGRTSLFRWHPTRIVGSIFEIRWWRKQNIHLMRTFLTRSEDKEIQNTCALFLLTALANVHPRCGESFPWLVEQENEDD